MVYRLCNFFLQKLSMLLAARKFL